MAAAGPALRPLAVQPGRPHHARQQRRVRAGRRVPRRAPRRPRPAARDVRRRAATDARRRARPTTRTGCRGCARPTAPREATIDARSHAFGVGDPPLRPRRRSGGTLEGGSHGPLPYARRARGWGDRAARARGPTGSTSWRPNVAPATIDVAPRARGLRRRPARRERRVDARSRSPAATRRGGRDGRDARGLREPAAVPHPPAAPAPRPPRRVGARLRARQAGARAPRPARPLRGASWTSAGSSRGATRCGSARGCAAAASIVTKRRYRTLQRLRRALSAALRFGQSRTVRATRMTRLRFVRATIRIRTRPRLWRRPTRTAPRRSAAPQAAADQRRAAAAVDVDDDLADPLAALGVAEADGQGLAAQAARRQADGLGGLAGQHRDVDVRHRAVARAAPIASVTSATMSRDERPTMIR